MPDSAVRSFFDPGDYQRAIRGGDVQLSVTEAGQFESMLTRIDLHRLWMQRGQEKLPRLVRCSHPTRSAIFFLTLNQQRPMQNSGVELAPGCLISYASDAEHYQRTYSECHWGAMSLAPNKLAAEFLTMTGRDLIVASPIRLIRPAPAMMSRLLALHDAAARLALSVPDILAHPEVARAMEQELVQVMVSCLSDGLEVTTITPRHRRIPIMRRFEHVLEANRDGPLYVSEICKGIGVSARTLQAECREHLGMGPHRYLWLRRMNMAHRALVLAEPTIRTVTDIATENGFWELGRFAVEYRRLFGEPPSATLRRTPGDPGTLHRKDPAILAHFA